MVVQERTIFEGLECIQIKNENLSIWITVSVGPRIIGLVFNGSDNFMAVLPDAKIPVEGRSDYSLRGGHRLWYAPENPMTTYLTDDKPVEYEPIQNGLKVRQPVDQKTGIQKSWQVKLANEKAQVEIQHELINLGENEFELAPWAVTMLRPGGIGIIPLKKDFDDEHGLHPNRQLILWPYSKIDSPHLEIIDEAIAVKGNMVEGAIKIGSPNPTGWIAYSYKGSVFIKKATYKAQEYYLDRGASSQIYCNPTVIELETLGPVVNLKPGEKVIHVENWEVFSEGNWPGDVLNIFNSFSKP
ncbi:MAG: hypothetical protein V3R33_08055 [Anaerolineales bacterium]